MAGIACRPMIDRRPGDIDINRRAGDLDRGGKRNARLRRRIPERLGTIGAGGIAIYILRRPGDLDRGREVLAFLRLRVP